MANDNLTGQFVSSTYRKLLHLSDNGDYITDGTGSIVNILPVTAAYAQNGGTAITTFTQFPAAATWSFTHNLGVQYPIITVYDSTDKVIVPEEIEAINSNELKIYFPWDVSGKATAAAGAFLNTAQIDTSTFATTGSNYFVGTQTITGSVNITGSLNVNTALITSIYTSLTGPGSHILYRLPTSSYDGFWFEYTVRSGSNASAGQLMGIWSGSSVNYTEVTTTEFGSTAGINFMSTVSAGDMIITSSTTTAGWYIKGIIRSI
jgi:hypothetical protein